MSDLFNILLLTALADNLVLEYLLGAYTIQASSRRLELTLPLALGTTVLLTLGAGLAWILRNWLLQPLQAEDLLAWLLLPVMAALSVPVQRLLQRRPGEAGKRYAVLIPLMIANAALVGVALLNAAAPAGLLHEMGRGLGYGLGFSLVLILFSGLHERLQTNMAQIPSAFRGVPIILVTLGLMSLAFRGLS